MSSLCTLRWGTLVAFWLMLLVPHVHAQEYNEEHWDGQLYLSFHPEARVALLPLKGLGNNPELEALNALFNQYKVSKATLPYALLESEVLQHTYRVWFAQPGKERDFIEQLQGLEYVAYAEQVPIMRTSAPYTPNDPGVQNPLATNYQYNLDAINGFDAFGIHQGGGAVVAIVDDAVQWDHEDLASNRWINPTETPGNGIDDDGNGYVDDIHGADVADGDGDPMPPYFDPSDFAHGTHVAGISGATTDNARGIASIGFGNKIMSVKTLGDNGMPGTIPFGYDGVAYAAAMGADVINMSWGGSGASITEYNVIVAARNAGSILIAAAGNSNVSSIFYPAGYGATGSFGVGVPPLSLPQDDELVIAVASTDQSNVRSPFSNYGTWIDISAPGSDIYSTLPGDTYGTKSGTSMASPLVAGVVGLLASHSPSSTNADLLSCLLSNALPLSNPDLGVGLVQADLALQCLCPPASAITGLTASLVGGGAIPTVIDLGTTLSVTASATAPSGSPAYEWTLDGTVVNAANASHTFNTLGFTTLTIVASNPANTTCSQILTFPVEVVCPNPVTLTSTSNSIPATGSVTFTATATPITAPVTYRWFVDGVLQSGQTGTSFLYTPGITGIYQVCLEVTNQTYGCIEQLCQTVVVGSCEAIPPVTQEWHFGTNLQVDFDLVTGTVTTANTGIFATEEAAGMVTDPAGNLLFASNGISVVNAAGVALPLAAGVSFPTTTMGAYNALSNIQGVFFIEHPGFADTYLLFLMDGSTGSGTGLHVYTVEVAANPQGGIVSHHEHVFTTSQTTESVIGTQDCDRTGFWVLTQPRVPNAPKEPFYSYHITASLPKYPTTADLNAVLTTSPAVYFGGFGMYKFSPDGAKLLTPYGALYDFDNSTGLVDNYRQLPAAVGNVIMHEFSSNSEYAYVSTTSNTINQVELNSLTVVNTLTSPVSGSIFSMQLSPLGTIFYTQGNQNQLYYIQNANTTSPTLATLATPAYPGIGFPNLPVSYYEQGGITIHGEDDVCEGAQLETYQIGNICQGAVYSWSVISGPATIVQNNGHEVEVDFTGLGTVVLEATMQGPCGTETDQITITVHPFDNFDLGPDRQICQGSSTLVNLGTWNDRFWADNYSAAQYRSLSAAGVYGVWVQNANGCWMYDEIEITVATPSPTCQLQASYFMANPFLGITLDAGGPASSYLWSTGAPTQQITVFQTGTYSVTVTDACGNQTTCYTTVTSCNVSATASATSSTCGACDGSVTVTPTGGVAPYTYLWDDPSASTTATVNNLCTGSYNVTVTDANGCQVVASTSVGNGVATPLATYYDFDFSGPFPSGSSASSPVLITHQLRVNASQLGILNNAYILLGPGADVLVETGGTLFLTDCTLEFEDEQSGITVESGATLESWQSTFTGSVCNGTTWKGIVTEGNIISNISTFEHAYQAIVSTGTGNYLELLSNNFHNNWRSVVITQNTALDYDIGGNDFRLTQPFLRNRAGDYATNTAFANAHIYIAFSYRTNNSPMEANTFHRADRAVWLEKSKNIQIGRLPASGIYGTHGFFTQNRTAVHSDYSFYTKVFGCEIDGQGQTGSSGIVVLNKSWETEIQQNLITHHDRGIYAQGLSDVFAIDNEIREVQTGIELLDMHDGSVELNTLRNATRFGRGIRMLGSNSNGYFALGNNRVETFKIGFDLSQNVSAEVAENLVINVDDAFRLVKTGDATLSGNIVDLADQYGIYIADLNASSSFTGHLLIHGNYLGHVQEGIFISNSNFEGIKSNIMRGNFSGTGFEMQDSEWVNFGTYEPLQSNVVEDYDYGYRIINSEVPAIENNRAANLNRDGFYFEFSQPHTTLWKLWLNTVKQADRGWVFNDPQYQANYRFLLGCNLFDNLSSYAMYVQEGHFTYYDLQGNQGVFSNFAGSNLLAANPTPSQIAYLQYDYPVPAGGGAPNLSAYQPIAATGNVNLGTVPFWTDNCAGVVYPRLAEEVAPVQETALEMTVYPNPTQGTATVTLPNPGSWNYQLVDMQGRVLDTGTTQNRTFLLNLDKLSAGLYRVQVQNGDQLHSQTIVKN